MLSIREKADWSTPGLKGRMKDGVYKGRLYTAMPLRFITAGRNAFIASVTLSGLLLWASSEEYALIDGLYAFVGFFLFLTYPFFVCVDPGKRIKITKSHLYVGARRYELHACGRFWSSKSKYDRSDEIIKFDYGNKDKEIRIRNSWRHTQNIIQTLNNAREQVCSYRQKQRVAATGRLETRSATF